MQESSGVLRTLAYSRYLKDHGWDVTVLTVARIAYPSVRPENERMMPEHVSVVRSFALDTRRHLSLFGRYPGRLAIPDRWRSWVPGAVSTGRRLIREWRPSVIYSTYPIASAHVIASRLCRGSGIPWIADFRDPMVFETVPSEHRLRESFERIEANAMRDARRITVTTPGTADLYAQRYGEGLRSKISVIQNGYDETVFEGLSPTTNRQGNRQSSKLALLHSGTIYERERDPVPFFRALSRLKAMGDISAASFEVVFRAADVGDNYAKVLRDLDIGDIVAFKDSIAYEQALEEMLGVDALLLMQGPRCNMQIPAKAYEYLYAGRPLLGLTDPDGDTGRMLADCGITSIVHPDIEDDIVPAVRSFLGDVRRGTWKSPKRQSIEVHSRRQRTADLAGLLDSISACP